jgi:hypothetical protein
MSRVTWDEAGDRIYETGVDRGLLFIPDNTGAYDTGVAWNGLTTATETPSGAESNPQYADNIKYLDLTSAEEFGGTIEAFTYPPQFAVCDGTAIVNGVEVGQQNRRPFGFVYRSLIGNDTQGTDFGYKLHLWYGCKAAPSEKAYATVNDSPEPINFSWEVTTSPVVLGEVEGQTLKPTASLVINSTAVTADSLKALEDMLYGTVSTEPSLPSPREVIEMMVATAPGGVEATQSAGE